MFPNGWPGGGLLLLRIVTGAVLCVNALIGINQGISRGTLLCNLVAAGFGFLLLIGFWTPIAGTLLAVTALLAILLGTDKPLEFVLLMAIGAGVAMLGPGAWSVDSMLFGRRRVDVSNR